ncbi:MAG: phage baseplate assembly protein [Ruminococcus sp.]|nr:phage baseplate assembly protein [Ruminococcus sp.]
MWISRYVTENSFAKDSASVGVVRAAAGDKVAVSATNEHLSLPVVLPYGIAYAPPVGSRSVVLPSEAGNLCLGVLGEKQNDLQPGELMLYSAGGASIVLKNDGRVLINSKAVE